MIQSEMAALHAKREASKWTHAHRRVTFLPGGVVRTDLNAGYQTRTLLEGPIDTTIAALEAYLRSYPPEGYQTRQVESHMGVGCVRYILERNNSCE
jgi:hypothetical protein